jgi:hypothetical protein
MNGLLKRELHVYTTELKRIASAALANAGPEPDILKGYKKVRSQPSVALFRMPLCVRLPVWRLGLAG